MGEPFSNSSAPGCAHASRVPFKSSLKVCDLLRRAVPKGPHGHFIGTQAGFKLIRNLSSLVFTCLATTPRGFETAINKSLLRERKRVETTPCAHAQDSVGWNLSLPGVVCYSTSLKETSKHGQPQGKPSRVWPHHFRRHRFICRSVRAKARFRSLATQHQNYAADSEQFQR